MEIESKDRKQRNYNTFLTASTAVSLTVALLLGAALVIFYAHFQATNAALEARIAAIEARELAAAGLEVASDTDTGETPGTSTELYSVSAPLLMHALISNAYTYTLTKRAQLIRNSTMQYSIEYVLLFTISSDGETSITSANLLVCSPKYIFALKTDIMYTYSTVFGAKSCCVP